MFPEPAAAAALAGYQQATAAGHVDPSSRTVVISTGSGLKDVAAVLRGVTAAGRVPIRVAPEESALDELLQETGTNQ